MPYSLRMSATRSTSPVEKAKKATRLPDSTRVLASAMATCMLPWNAMVGRGAMCSEEAGWEGRGASDTARLEGTGQEACPTGGAAMSGEICEAGWAAAMSEGAGQEGCSTGGGAVSGEICEAGWAAAMSEGTGQ